MATIVDILPLLGVGALLILSLSLRQLSTQFRRRVTNPRRAKRIKAAFPEAGFEPWAANSDVAGFSTFPELYNAFDYSLKQILMGAGPEIYNLVFDESDGTFFSLFDLRLPKSLEGGGAATGSTFVLHRPGTSLVPFSLTRESFGHTALWGEDEDIDIPGQAIFSQNFYLTGEDRDAVLALMDNELVGFIRSNTQLFAAGRLEVRSASLYFRYVLKMEADELKRTLELLLRFYEMLRLRVPDHQTISE